MNFDPERFGKDMAGNMKDIVRERDRVLRKEREALEDRLEKILKALSERVELVENREPESGPKGDKGDTPEVSVEDAAKALANEPEIKTVIRLVVEEQLDDAVKEAVKEELKANPPAPGKDGNDGLTPSFMQDSEGHLKAVYSNERVEDLGPVKGRDGISADDFSARYDPERGAVMTVTVAGATKEFEIPIPVPRYVDFWGKGVSASPGEIYTHNGSAWICLNATKEEPGYKAQDWHLFARKGSNA